MSHILNTEHLMHVDRVDVDAMVGADVHAFRGFGADRVEQMIAVAGQQDGGILKRLRATVRSIYARRGVRFFLDIEPDDRSDRTDSSSRSAHFVTWSDAGCWTHRAWWADIEGTVDTDVHGEVVVWAKTGALLVVSEAGEMTYFVGAQVGALLAGVVIPTLGRDVLRREADGWSCRRDTAPQRGEFVEKLRRGRPRESWVEGQRATRAGADGPAPEARQLVVATATKEPDVKAEALPLSEWERELLEGSA